MLETEVKGWLSGVRHSEENTKSYCEMSANFQLAMKKILEMDDCGLIAFKLNTQKW